MDANSGPAIICFGVKCLKENKYKEAVKSLTEGKCVIQDVTWTSALVYVEKLGNLILV